MKFSCAVTGQQCELQHVVHSQFIHFTSVIFIRWLNKISD